MIAANAAYTPSAKGILFGYFRASETDPGRNLPGQPVFTCLSHDIIAHETTHAVLDGIRTYFSERTNPDVPAFHEAFADLAALFLHFSHKEALLDTIQKTGGRLYKYQLQPDAGTTADKDIRFQAQMATTNPLIGLAQQFGEARGTGRALRSALSVPPNAKLIKNRDLDPHERGAILVSAVFDAYFTTYMRQTSDLFRLFRAGGGNVDAEELPGPLANLLAEAASRTADRLFQICVRAIDYCPPVDITFGDYLRAIITADRDLYPTDEAHIRDAFMQAFRLRGILPENARYFSEDALAWPRVPRGALPPVEGLLFGDPNGLTPAEKNHNGDVLRAYAKDHAVELGFRRDLFITVPSFHPTFRVAPDGSLRMKMVVEMAQTVEVPFDPRRPELGTFPMRGGATLLIEKVPWAPNLAPRICYLIQKRLDHEDGRARETPPAPVRHSPGSRRRERSPALSTRFQPAAWGPVMSAARKSRKSAPAKTPKKKASPGKKRSGSGKPSNGKSPATGGAGTAPAVASAGAAGLKVRMYRVGFGDFFLLDDSDECWSALHPHRLRRLQGHDRKGRPRLNRRSGRGSLSDDRRQARSRDHDPPPRRSHRRLQPRRALQGFRGEHGVDAVLGAAQ